MSDTFKLKCTIMNVASPKSPPYSPITENIINFCVPKNKLHKVDKTETPCKLVVPYNLGF